MNFFLTISAFEDLMGCEKAPARALVRHYLFIKYNFIV